MRGRTGSAYAFTVASSKRAVAKAAGTAVDLVKFGGVAAGSFVVGVVTSAAIGAGLGSIVALTLFLAGAFDQPWRGWAYLRWLVLAAYPLGSAVAIGWAAAWRKAGKILVHAGVESGLVAHVTEGFVEQTTRALAASPPHGTNDRTKWKRSLRRALDDYLRRDDLEDQASGMARRVLRRLKRIIGRLLVRTLLGHAELLALLAGAVDGSEEAERDLIDRLEASFGQAVGFLTRRPTWVVLVALPLGYAVIPLALALVRLAGL